jgi:hypothetical protein
MMAESYFKSANRHGKYFSILDVNSMSKNYNKSTDKTMTSVDNLRRGLSTLKGGNSRVYPYPYPSKGKGRVGF